MTAAPDDPAGSAPERPLGQWGTSEGESTWSSIASEAEPSGPGPAGPGPSSAPAGEAGRRRRPSSLRAAVEAAGELPRRMPTSLPRLHSDPHPPAGDPAAVTGDVDPAPSGPSPIEKLVTLVQERPEVGLGIAFVGGIVIATILKRLAH